MTEQLVEAVVERLLESDALTPNHDGTPEYYVVGAANVDYLVRTVIAAASDVVAELRDAEEEEWDVDDYDSGDWLAWAVEAGYLPLPRPVETVHLPGDAPGERCKVLVERGGGVVCDRYAGHDGPHGWGTGPFSRRRPAVAP